MPKYRIYVPMTFDDVYIVEAPSAEEARKMWYRGEVSYGECFQHSTDSSEMDTWGVEAELEDED
jgi:hypothetical protein